MSCYLRLKRTYPQQRWTRKSDLIVHSSNIAILLCILINIPYTGIKLAWYSFIFQPDRPAILEANEEGILQVPGIYTRVDCKKKWGYDVPKKNRESFFFSNESNILIVDQNNGRFVISIHGLCNNQYMCFQTKQFCKVI